MNYGFTKWASNWNEKALNSIGVRLINAILCFVPRANTDEEKLYQNAYGVVAAGKVVSPERLLQLSIN